MSLYANIKTHNLGFVLFIAKMLAYLGVILFCAIVYQAVAEVFEADSFSFYPALIMLPYCIGSLFLSSVLAFCVEMENNYKQRVIKIQDSD